jgi:hypothetical protein
MELIKIVERKEEAALKVSLKKNDAAEFRKL